MRKDDVSDQTQALLQAISGGAALAVTGEVQQLLEAIFEDGSVAALAQIEFPADRSIVEQVHELAVAYARERAAEMVGKKWVDGELVDNPDAQWVIDDATRELLRADVTDALQQGLSNDDLAARIAGSYAFSDDRAETIARTETAFADVGGNLSAYRASGQVIGKQWIVGAGCCDECQELDGVTVGLDEEFPDDGGAGPPLHPNCRCDVLPITSEE